jgi:hypothetical protein
MGAIKSVSGEIGGWRGMFVKEMYNEVDDDECTMTA